MGEGGVDLLSSFLPHSIFIADLSEGRGGEGDSVIRLEYFKARTTGRESAEALAPLGSLLRARTSPDGHYAYIVYNSRCSGAGVRGHPSLAETGSALDPIVLFGVGHDFEGSKLRRLASGGPILIAGSEGQGVLCKSDGKEGRQSEGRGQGPAFFSSTPNDAV